jgi:cell division protein FtsB
VLKKINIIDRKRVNVRKEMLEKENKKLKKENIKLKEN